MKLNINVLLDAMPDSSMSINVTKNCCYGVFEFVV